VGHLRSSKASSRSSDSRRKTLQLAGVLCLVLLVGSSDLWARSLDSTIIGMFPKDADDIGYADLNQARELPWYPQFEAQLVPVALFGFEQFLELAAMRQTSPINQVAWASVGAARSSSDQTAPNHPASGSGQPVAVAIGDFDIDTIKAFLGSKSILSVEVGGYTLYASGTASGSSNVFFAFLDSETIVFGPLEPLKRVLAIRDGEEDSLLRNESMMTLIDKANGDAVFWGVLNSAAGGRAIERLVPEAAKFPQSRDLLGKLKEVLITVRVSDDIELDLQVAAVSPSDAVTLSQLLQAGVLVRRHQTDSENNPEMAKLLDAVYVGSNGTVLDVSVQLTNDQLFSLIEHNTFSIQM
jgi:hypothetical protein